MTRARPDPKADRLYTSCPHCEHVHALGADELARAGGMVRCGHCRQRFNALPRLSEAYPDRVGGTPAPPPGRLPPVIGADPATPEAEELAAAWQKDPAARRERPRGRRAWIIAVVVLLLATAANLAWWFHDLRELQRGSDEASMAWRDPTAIRLVSRDFHAHPSRGDILVLSASFVNLAERPQPFPTLAVTLLNADDRPLAHREFEPETYLLEGIDPVSAMQPQVQVPILLEFADPGENAVGFELEFR